MINLDQRARGILCPIFSLPSKFGIGTLGKTAFDFVDYLSDTGYKYWQILPIHPPTIDNSPYTAYSAFAGNELFLDLDELCESGYISTCDFENFNFGNDKARVDYISVIDSRKKIYQKLFKNFIKNKPSDFNKFCEDESDWLDGYSQFMTIHDYLDGAVLVDWPYEYKKPTDEFLSNFCEDHSEEILYYKVLQYCFFEQWNKFKNYANSKDVYIIGDIPYYVSGNSADVWQNSKSFNIDDNLNPLQVAGCPPDMFCVDGQLWGNPVYDWKYLKDNDYSWWINRLRQSFRFFDVLRIDHFRGFESYYSIPADAKTAKIGKWVKGPGLDLFKKLENKLGKQSIIAEDLGYITKDVIKLLHDCGYPGMKVLQFGFDSRVEPKEAEIYLPHNVVENSVCYIGTHDNDTLQGWIDNASDDDINVALDYFNLNSKDELFDKLMDTLLNSVANTRIICVQDLLKLGSSSRINTPALVSTKNWSWRLTQEQFENLRN